MVSYVSVESAVSILRIISTVKMEAADTFGKLVTFHDSPLQHIQEDRKLNIHRCEKFKPQIVPFFVSTMHNGCYSERMLGPIMTPVITTY
jgi:hypothetical protein